MFKFIGFGIGTTLALAYGLTGLYAPLYFLICGLLSILTVLLSCLFRLLASKFTGFWKGWLKRWYYRMEQAKQCSVTLWRVPQLQVKSISVDSYGNRIVRKSTKVQTLIWRICNLLFSILLVCASGLLLLIVFYCYIEAITFQCEARRLVSKEKTVKAHEIELQNVAKNELRDSLSDPFEEGIIKSSSHKRERQIYVRKAIVYNRKYPSELDMIEIDELTFSVKKKEQENSEKDEKDQLLETDSLLDFMTEKNRERARRWQSIYTNGLHKKTGPIGEQKGPFGDQKGLLGEQKEMKPFEDIERRRYANFLSPHDSVSNKEL